MFDGFSNNAWLQNEDSGTYGSLEDLHGEIHDKVGSGGHMGALCVKFSSELSIHSYRIWTLVVGQEGVENLLHRDTVARVIILAVHYQIHMLYRVEIADLRFTGLYRHLIPSSGCIIAMLIASGRSGRHCTLMPTSSTKSVVLRKPISRLLLELASTARPNSNPGMMLQAPSSGIQTA
jgi:hypothetical protein